MCLHSVKVSLSLSLSPTCSLVFCISDQECFSNIYIYNAGIEEEAPAEYRYPFIKAASSFLPPSSSASGDRGATAYDYIVVGGGTAGCPLAATLSQNYTVLVLERGGTPFANANVSLMQNFHIALADISETSPSQMFISTEGVFNSRARVLGGGTCINAGFYTRAGPRYEQQIN